MNHKFNELYFWSKIDLTNRDTVNLHSTQADTFIEITFEDEVQMQLRFEHLL